VEKVGVINSTFGSDFQYGSGKRSKYNPRLGRTIHNFSYKIQVIFGDKGTNLVFENLVGGKVESRAKIKFDQR